MIFLFRDSIINLSNVKKTLHDTMHVIKAIFEL